MIYQSESFDDFNIDFNGSINYQIDLWDEIIMPKSYPSFNCAEERPDSQNKVDATIKDSQKSGCSNASKPNDNSTEIKINVLHSTHSKAQKLDSTINENQERSSTSPSVPQANISNVQDSPQKIQVNLKSADDQSNKSDDELSASNQHANRNDDDGSNKVKRFGRNEDREMFVKLKELCAQQQCKIADFNTVECKNNSKLSTILDDIMSQIKFKGSKTFLLKRIQKLNRSQKFSVREMKLLKKTFIAQLKEGIINLNEIEYLFPGKKPCIIRKYVSKLLASS